MTQSLTFQGDSRTLISRPIFGASDWRFTIVTASADRSRTDPRALAVITRKQAQIDALRDGWRGPGTRAPSRTARELFAATVAILPAQFLLDAQPAPTADGGIHMEWERGNTGYSAEITSTGNLIVDVFAEDENDDAEMILSDPVPAQLVGFISRGIDGLGV